MTSWRGLRSRFRPRTSECRLPRWGRRLGTSPRCPPRWAPPKGHVERALVGAHPRGRLTGGFSPVTIRRRPRRPPRRDHAGSGRSVAPTGVRGSQRSCAATGRLRRLLHRHRAPRAFDRAGTRRWRRPPSPPEVRLSALHVPSFFALPERAHDAPRFVRRVPDRPSGKRAATAPSAGQAGMCRAVARAGPSRPRWLRSAATE